HRSVTVIDPWLWCILRPKLYLSLFRRKTNLNMGRRSCDGDEQNSSYFPNWYSSQVATTVKAKKDHT
ncbi:hypothetical protein M8C21_026133, partial [Ambrosia artemisiifolia]